MKCTLPDPFQNCLGNFDWQINMALVNGGYLHCTDMKKFFSEINCQSLKHFHRDVPRVFFFKIVCKILICQETAQIWGGLLALYLGPLISNTDSITRYIFRLAKLVYRPQD